MARLSTTSGWRKSRCCWAATCSASARWNSRWPIEQTPGKPKRPKVSDIKEAVARTAEGSGVSTATELDDVSQWLEEADTEEKQRRYTDPETRQFRLDDTAMPPEDKKKADATTETKAH